MEAAAKEAEPKKEGPGVRYRAQVPSLMFKLTCDD